MFAASRWPLDFFAVARIRHKDLSIEPNTNPNAISLDHLLVVYQHELNYLCHRHLNIFKDLLIYNLGDTWTYYSKVVYNKVKKKQIKMLKGQF